MTAHLQKNTKLSVPSTVDLYSGRHWKLNLPKHVFGIFGQHPCKLKKHQCSLKKQTKPKQICIYEFICGIIKECES